MMNKKKGEREEQKMLWSIMYVPSSLLSSVGSVASFVVFESLLCVAYESCVPWLLSLAVDE